MRISKIKIDKYGPLEDIVLEPSEGFQLYFGENESGKTLLVDAIIKLIIGDRDDRFPQLSRVDKPPAGSLVLETDDGEEIVLPGDGFERVADSVEFGDFSVEDLRNAFIIRDVDLRRPNKGDFWQSDYFKRLTDSLIGVETQRIKDIREELRDIGFLTNATSKSKLRNTKPDKLGDKKKSAGELKRDIEEYREECEREGVVEKFPKKKELEQKINDAEKRLELLSKAKRKKKLEEGRNLLGELEEKTEEIEKHGAKEEENEEYRKIQSDINDVNERRESEKLSPGRHRKGFIASSVLFTVSVIGAIFGPVLIQALSLAFAISLGYFGWKLFGWYRLEKKDSDIVDRANRLGIEGDTLTKISARVGDYLKKFEEKKENLEDRKWEIMGNLQGKFSSQGKTLDYWKKRIEDFAGEVDEEIEAEYDESEESDLKNSIGNLREESEEIEKFLNEHSERIRDFDKEISNIPLDRFLDVGEVEIRSVGDLGQAVGLLEEFLEKINSRVEYSQQAIAILEDLESEEKQEINELLDGDGYALRFFKDVTDHNYIDLGYDEDEDVVEVTRADGKELTPDELSQSTYDLLYMAIRISLARKLMGDKAGFQILDSPFLQSDSNRIKKEMKLLKRLAKDGWNIIYFSYRKSVKETIENFFGNDVINVLPPLKFK